MTKGSDGKKSQWILSSDVLCNANTKPSKLKEQLDNKHGRLNHGQDSESLKNKRVCFDSSGTLQKMKFVSADKPLILASCKVAYEIAKKQKKAKQKLQQVPLSDTVISNRISDISNDILNQIIIIDIKNSPTKISI